MKLCFVILAFTVAAAWARAEEVMIPVGKITAETPSLEAAYLDEISIQRTPLGEGVIEYGVRVYAPGLLKQRASWDIIMVIRDDKGAEIFFGKLDTPEEVSTIPPSKEEFRSFGFRVNERVEKTTVIYIGRFTGMNNLYTGYRLPLKTIENPKAHR